MARRPDTLAVVAGTGTGVGKTWVAAALATALRTEGRRVSARKPAQSYAPHEAATSSTDAHILAAATGEQPDAVCPAERWFPLPMAPPMAADAVGRPPFTVADLAAGIHWPAGTDIGLVETAGGVRSPLAQDGDATTLIRQVEPDVVILVADAGLGTINAVRLSAEALAPIAGRLPVLLNRFDPDDDLHRRNRDWLAARDGLTIHTTIHELAGELR